MKNITIAIDDETHRAARVRAAELGTSVSALVKAYLQELAGGASPPPALSGVREMPLAFKPAPAPTPAGPPWLIDGKWVYTPDGKPRQPGALRKAGKRVDVGETPDWLIEAMEHWDENDFDPLP